MKYKTSITLSEDILKEVDTLAGEFKNRSVVIEEALRYFLKKRVQKMREEHDLKILNAKAEAINREAEDVLSYQVDL